MDVILDAILNFDFTSMVGLLNAENAVIFFTGLALNPKQLGGYIVSGIRKVVPKRFQKFILRFLNQLGKGLDSAINDEEVKAK